MNKISGLVGTPVTPFTKADEIDEKTTRKLLDFLIDESKSNAIALPMHIGESLNLSMEERKKIAEIAIDQVNGRVPVLVHVSCPGTDHAVALAKHAEDAGADGVVCLIPYHWRPDSRAVYSHYEKICGSTDLGVLGYNFPERIGVTLEPHEVFQVAENFHNFIGLKDASFNMEYFTEVCRLTSRLKGFGVFTGLEYLVPSISLGGSGSFCGASAIAPRTVSKLYEHCVKGEFREALPLQQKISQVLRLLTKYRYPSSVKVAMEIMARPVGIARLPNLLLTDEERNSLRKEMKEAGLLESERTGW